MTKTTEVAVIEREVAPIVTKALEVVIKDQKGLTVATEFLSRINTIADRIEEEKAKVLDPLNAARKAEMARWKPLETMYEKAIGYLRAEISVFQTSEVKRQREEEKRIADRVGAGKGSYKLDTAMRKMGEVEKAIEKVSVASGSLKFREVQKLKIVDAVVIPREYLVVNESKVLEALKAGIIIPGCEIELVQIPVNSRN